MVNLTIDGKQISVEENTTIMEAAKQNGIPCVCGRSRRKRQTGYVL